MRGDVDSINIVDNRQPMTYSMYYIQHAQARYYYPFTTRGTNAMNSYSERRHSIIYYRPGR